MIQLSPAHTIWGEEGGRVVCKAKFLFKIKKKTFLRHQPLSLGSFTVFSFLFNSADTGSVVTFSPKTQAFSSTR